jgi:hypothetical protein
MVMLDILGLPVAAGLAAFGIYECATGTLRDGIYLVVVGTIGFLVSGFALLKARRGEHERRRVT